MEADLEHELSNPIQGFIPPYLWNIELVELSHERLRGGTLH